MTTDYAARTKYDEPGRARRYRQRSPKRDAEEWSLVARALDALPEPPTDALDVPCGTGRVAEHLIRRGVPTTLADLSPAMRAEAAQRLEGQAGFRGLHALDLEESDPDPALAADLVICFRFFHHLPDAASRARVLRCLSRLTKRWLLLSFHHPVSGHNLGRLARRLVSGRRADRRTLSVGRLRREAREQGLDLVALHPLARYRRELWLARFGLLGG